MITNRTFAAATTALATSALLAAAPAAHAQNQTASQNPNVIVLLVDDLGISDLACYGAQHGNTYHETPNIDKLAAQGMRFTNAYATCPVCSPTRASLVTGKYPTRTRITDYIAGEPQPTNRKVLTHNTHARLELREFLVSEAFKEAGYFTIFAGKWHLGWECFGPTDQGFDVNIAGKMWGRPRGRGTYNYPFDMPNLPGEPGDYLTNRITDEVIKQIESSVANDKPFFCYLSFYQVHTPLVPDKNDFAHFNNKPKTKRWKNQKYASMVYTMDRNVGRIMDTLKQQGVDDNTIILFTSDNGGLRGVTSNYPYRAGKGNIYEGGIREPLIIRWPGVVQPGSISDQITTSTDVYPTLLQAAGLKLRPKQHKDGVSLVPVLKQEVEKLDRDTIYWHFPHFRGNAPKMPAGAVRSGDFKLIEDYETGSLELYNLKTDIAEKNNLAEQMPEKAYELQKMLADWRVQTGALMPQPNPTYKPKSRKK